MSIHDRLEALYDRMQITDLDRIEMANVLIEVIKELQHVAREVGQLRSQGSDY